MSTCLILIERHLNVAVSITTWLLLLVLYSLLHCCYSFSISLFTLQHLCATPILLLCIHSPFHFHPTPALRYALDYALLLALPCCLSLLLICSLCSLFVHVCASPLIRFVLSFIHIVFFLLGFPQWG